METNVIYSGDNIETMQKSILDGSIDLIYADPPFFSEKKYEVIWGDGYELRSFEDRWKGGIYNYIAWMKPRLTECQRVLKDTGSMYLHCDFHANAHLRILMDKIFGINNFRNEIIWHYRTGNITTKRLARRHDTILLYSKSNKPLFNPFEKKEYYSQIYGPAFKPSFKGRKHGKDKHGEYRIRYIDDVWNISAVFTLSKENLRYPTQKPIALLKRIISLSSNPTDIVLDPFCGCGTAIAAAHMLGRRWIGIDVSPTACKLMVKRMRKLGVRKPKVIGLPRTVAELKALQPFEFQNWVFEKLHGRVNPRKIGDMGIDGWIELDVPTQVKQSYNVGRNVVDNFETAIRRYGKKRGVIVAFSFTRGANEEVARVKLQDEMRRLDIKLKTVKEILKET